MKKIFICLSLILACMPAAVFAADQLNIVSMPLSIRAGSSILSDSIVVHAETAPGTFDPDCNAPCAFYCTQSYTARFSLDGSAWTDTNRIDASLVNGEAIIYFRDTKSGSPAIIVKSAGLAEALQVQSVSPEAFTLSASYISFGPYRVPADGVTACNAVVTVCDTYGNPIPGLDITLSTSRGNSDVISPSATLTSDAAGRGVFGIVSDHMDVNTVTITASCEGQLITRGINTDGAIGIWHFDQDVLDFSGKGNNGTITSGSTPYG